jgi:hypothetical protein
MGTLWRVWDLNDNLRRRMRWCRNPSTMESARYIGVARIMRKNVVPLDPKIYSAISLELLTSLEGLNT